MRFHLPWNKPKNNLLLLIIFVVAAQLAGAVGTIFTIPSIPNWYAALTKPVFSPPNWVFGPVWTLLYTLMGITAYLIWQRHQFRPKARLFWRAYGTQLALNTLWSILFFGLHWVGLALIEIIIMWYFIYLSIVRANQLFRPAAYLLYPYLAWVSFATILNLGILVLN